jgi:hypothetical protein
LVDRITLDLDEDVLGFADDLPESAMMLLHAGHTAYQGPGVTGWQRVVLTGANGAEA